VSGARILMIEDTPHNLELMTYLLEASGHTVIPAMTGQRGLALARLERPDLIVLDVQLPDIDGYQVLARLRADRELPVPPVVAVTAYAMVGDRDTALAAGFDGYLSKPIDPVSFARDIDARLPSSLRGHAATPQWDSDARGAIRGSEKQL
jgi:CheY-like chemotaxis protein